MKIIILFSIVAVVLGQKSPYYSYNPEVYNEGFLPADHNGDGILKRDEFLQTFREKDINGDGFLSYTEYKRSKPIKTLKKVIDGEFKYYDKLDGENDAESLQRLLVV